MDVEARSALLSVSRAGLSGVGHDALVHGALEQLRRVTGCDVAAFYAVSKADGTLIRDQLRGEDSIEALPALHPHIAQAAGSAGPEPCETRTCDAGATRFDLATAVRSGRKTYGVLAAASAREGAAPSHRCFLRALADVLALSLRAERRRLAADMLLKRSREGRAQACFFAPAMHHAADKRLRLAGRLRDALDTGAFRLDYQPIYELNGTLCASEALIRWPQPDGTVVQPDEFIPYAEESGLIVPIGAWALRSACFQNAAWTRAARPLRVTVNVSAKQLAERHFVYTVCDALSESGMAPKLLELELTETAMNVNLERTVAIVRELRELGIRFAVDDFGTGYNSLMTLKSFVPDTLKLDRCFVADIATSPVDQAIAAAVIGAAHELGATVIAEGVETADQRAALAALECDAGQGYLFGRPMPAESLRELLGADSWERRRAGRAGTARAGGLPERRRLATSTR